MKTLRLIPLAALAAALAACAAPTPRTTTAPIPVTPVTVAPDVSADARAKAFFERTFDERVAASPEFAAQLGQRLRYSEWTPLTEAERQASLDRTRRNLAELERDIDRGALSPQGKLSYDIFATGAKRSIAGAEWRYHGYIFDQMNGLQSRIPAFLINTHRVETVADAEAYISRLNGVAERVDQAIAMATESERRGVLPPKFVFPYVVSDARNVITGAPFGGAATAVASGDSPLWADFKAKVGALQTDDATRTRLLTAG